MKSLFDLYSAHRGKVSVKWPIYLTEYDRLFSNFRKQPLKVLEIGIQNGGSLEILSKYFSNAQILVGCDINTDCSKLIFNDPRIQLVIGDINTDAVEKKILNHSTKFDLIIDDGSHISGDITKSFARYFRYLNEGGLFVVEDLHCSYWQEYEGGLYHPFSSIAFFKRLADLINYEHWGIEKTRCQLLQGFSERFSIEFDERELECIHSIEFFNSTCIVRKSKAKSNALGERFVAGHNEFVAPGHLLISGVSRAPPQEANEWTAMIQAPEEALKQLATKLSDRESQIVSVSQDLADRESQIANLNKTIHEIYRSNSWRATAPLRMVFKYLKGV